jgi:hypothetical protein
MKKEAPLKKQGTQKTSDEKRGTPKKCKGLKSPPMKNEIPQKCKQLKRPLMKKEAPLKAKGAKKYLHLEGCGLRFQKLSSRRTWASFQKTFV